MQTSSSGKVTSRHSFSQAMQALFTNRARALRRSYNLAYHKKYGRGPIPSSITPLRGARPASAWQLLDRDCVAEQVSALQSIRESNPRLVFEALRSRHIPFLSSSVNRRILRVALVSGRSLDPTELGLQGAAKPATPHHQREAV